MTDEESNPVILQMKIDRDYWKPQVDALSAKLAEAKALLRQCQPYVTLSVDNEYDGDKELVRGVAAFLAPDEK